MKRIFVKGNEAAGEAAVLAGCRYFFGYPITPQNELPEYLSRRLPEMGGVFLQAESEVAAINMVYGAASAGARAMTSSSGPGISLKQEGLSYLAGAELPCVVVNMMRGGPGLGGIHAAQGDYFQATKGGGHGDYRIPVLAPGNVQELVDLTYGAFSLAERYRTPVMIFGDGALGQMMEPVVFPPPAAEEHPEPPWAATGASGRERRVINSLYLDPARLEDHNLALQQKYAAIRAREQRFAAYRCADAELLLVAFGTAARICRSAVDALREKGIRAGLFRPVSLWPFPEAGLKEALGGAERILVVELNAGQMAEDVRLAVRDSVPVDFHGRMGGMLPSVQEIIAKAEPLAALRA